MILRANQSPFKLATGLYNACVITERAREVVAFEIGRAYRLATLLSSAKLLLRNCEPVLFCSVLFYVLCSQHATCSVLCGTRSLFLTLPHAVFLEACICPLFCGPHSPFGGKMKRMLRCDRHCVPATNKKQALHEKAIAFRLLCGFA